MKSKMAQARLLVLSKPVQRLGRATSSHPAAVAQRPSVSGLDAEDTAGFNRFSFLDGNAEDACHGHHRGTKIRQAPHRCACFIICRTTRSHPKPPPLFAAVRLSEF